MASITDQNWIIWNQGKNPLVNFNFMLRVELMFDLPCKSVRAFTRELEYDYIQEGGLNDYVHMRRKPITRPFTLEIERYVGVDYIDPLPLGADLVLPVLLFVSRNHDQFIPGVVARTYVFTGCTVMKKTYGDLVADQSGLLVETTTLGYREMLCVDIPWSEVGDNIPKDIKTVPTNAKSADKTPAELKALANDLYSQALAAKTQADVEFAETDAEALLKELEETLANLRTAVGPGGGLTQQLDTAKRGINGEGGKTKKALADEAMDDARLAEQEAKEKENAWREKDAVWRKAKGELDDIQTQMEGPAKKLEDLEAQLSKAEETKAELEVRLPVDLRDVEKARSAQQKAQTDYDAAEAALAEAKAALEKAMEDARDETDVKDAREKAESAAAEVASKQADVDEASRALAEAQKAYQTALRAWQEEQSEELERAAAKRSSCEGAVPAKQADVDEASRALEEAQKAYQPALQAWQEEQNGELERAAAERSSCEDAASAKQADVDKASQVLAEAQKAYQAALRPWQEEQGDELERTVAKRRSCEDAVRAKEEAVRKAGEDTLERAKEELTAAQKELEEARTAEEAVSETIEKGPEDGEAGQRRSAVESAEQALAEAQKELAAAEKEVEEARAAEEAVSKKNRKGPRRR